MDISISANIPESYISSGAQRMEMYKKISLIRDTKDYYDVSDELSDRFGEPPVRTVRLLDVALIKALAEDARIVKVEFKNGALSFYSEHPSHEIWAEVMPHFRGMMFRATTPPVLIYKLQRGEEVTAVARKILEKYSSVKNEEVENG